MHTSQNMKLQICKPMILERFIFSKQKGVEDNTIVDIAARKGDALRIYFRYHQDPENTGLATSFPPKDLVAENCGLVSKIEDVVVDRPKNGLLQIVKGSRKNKFAIFSVAAPGWQGAEVQKYQAYLELSQTCQLRCIVICNAASGDASLDVGFGSWGCLYYIIVNMVPFQKAMLSCYQLKLYQAFRSWHLMA